MRSILLTRYGEPADVLKLVTVEDPPAPGPGEVLIRVTKRLVHPGNHVLVRGHFPITLPPDGMIPGGDGVGVVEAIGDGVDAARGVAPGTRVIFYPGPGAWSERVITRAEFATPVPDDIPDELACQVLVNTIGALYLLRAAERAAGGRAGRETPIVLTAAGSAVARIMTTIALQRGLRVIGVVRSRDGAGSLSARFPDLPVVTTADADWPEQIHRAADSRPLDVIIDPIGGELAVELVQLLADGGTLLCYGDLADEPISIPSIVLAYREIRLQGVSAHRTLDNDSPEQRRDDAAEAIALARSDPGLFDVAAEYDLARVAEAMQAVEQPRRAGAILLSSDL
jgi:NADPH2:quinone reductase